MDSVVFHAAKCLYEFMSEHPTAPKRADLILALGSHDLRVADHAASLYLSGTAPLIVCSGAYGKMTEGVFQKPEGVLFAERCFAKGVPRESVLIEDKATNTGENFSLSRKLAQGMSFQSGIAVCKPYMAKRAWAAGTRQWPEVKWHVSTPAIPFERYSANEEALHMEIELMTGDLQRLKVYAEKGYQAPVDIPDSVWTAYEGLVRAGYDKYVIAN